MLQLLLIHFLLHYLSSGLLQQRVKKKGKFQNLSSKSVVMVAYERFSLTRGSKYSDLTGKRLVFWKTVH